MRNVKPVVELVLVIMLPTAAGYAILGAFRGLKFLCSVDWRRRAAVPAESIERLTANLRRLRSDLELTEARPGLTAKRHRVAALRGAYTDALASACRQLDVPPPPGGERARQADIYRAEAALRERGLDVRESAVH
jgi:hypothetical protein